MRSRSPGQLAAASARKKYTYAAFFLVLSLVAFCVQTELSAYIQGDLGWDKAYCMLFFTHSSWVLMWPAQLLILRLQKREMPPPEAWVKVLWPFGVAAMVFGWIIALARSRKKDDERLRHR